MQNIIHNSVFFLVLLFWGPHFSAEQVDQEAGIYPPDQMKWTDAPKSLPPGAKLAVLEGDPNQDGPFVMRLRLPDGYRIPAHTHPKTE